MSGPAYSIGSEVVTFHVAQGSVKSTHTANENKFIQVNEFTRRFTSVRRCAWAQVSDKVFDEQRTDKKLSPMIPAHIQ